MPHIHTEPGQHDLTVSIVILKKAADSETKVLLHMHKKLHRFMQFGGHVELNETPWAAVEHEMLEETGYKLTQMKLLQPVVRIKGLTDAIEHPLPICLNTHQTIPGHFHTDVSFVFVTEEEPAQALGVGESAEMKLFAESEVQSIDTEHNVKQVCLFAFEALRSTSFELVDPSTYSLTSL